MFCHSAHNLTLVKPATTKNENLKEVYQNIINNNILKGEKEIKDIKPYQTFFLNVGIFIFCF